jgi:UDP-N-acetylglucosamine 2-epimerase
MNGVFFEELSIRRPDIQLSLTATTHGAMTGELLSMIERIFLDIKPRGVLVYGDTNSTLAAALAAVKLRIPVAHVEAGPRLGTFDTPEEVNRIVADHVSTLRFACDRPSVENLRREGIVRNVINSGDVMFDVFKSCAARLTTAEVNARTKIFMTLHRPQNVDECDCHLKIINFIERCDADVIFPMHARTQTKATEFGLLEKYRSLSNLQMSGPLGYLESISSLIRSDFVITDSGGVQKEAYFAGKLALLMLPQTPWPDLQSSGWQILAGWIGDGAMASTFDRLRRTPKPPTRPDFFGRGNSAAIIVDALLKHDFIGT